MKTCREFFNRLNEWGIQEKKNIIKEKTFNKNFPFAFTDLGNLGEELLLYLDKDSLGSSSKGGCSFDNITCVDNNFNTIEAREVKFISLDGTKECKTCKIKAPPFQPNCLKCNESNNFKYFSDTRAGISASAHVKYKQISEVVIFISKYNDKLSKINLKCYKILSDNIYFETYCINQHENGKGNTCNLLPYSYDWYCSGPIKLLDININISTDDINMEILYDDFNNNISEPIPINIFNKYEVSNYNIIDEFTKYDDIKNLLIIRNKNLGKKRGTLLRK